MDSLKRWLRRLFDDLQFIVRYNPGDPVPQSASLYKTARLMERFWSGVYILAVMLGAIAGMYAAYRTAELFGESIAVTVGTSANFVTAVVLIAAMFGGAAAAAYATVRLTVHQSCQAHLVRGRLMHWYEIERTLNYTSSSGFGPSAPTSSSGGSGDERRGTSDVGRSARHDDGGIWGCEGGPWSRFDAYRLLAG
ncbi:MAG: hypothetical protein PHS79_04410 [Patescibacteria group bacterium]|nr:hypothetical protein [Patescibacteria group bacterium]